MSKSVLVAALNGRKVSSEISAKVEEGFDNFDFLFQCDIRNIIDSIHARIYYDPNYRKTEDRASYDWISRRFYFTNDGLQHSEIHEIAHMLDAEAGDTLGEATQVRRLLGNILFRSHHNWYARRNPERTLFEEYLCNSRLFIQYPGSAEKMLKMFKEQSEIPQTWKFMTERFAQFIEEYSYYQMAERNQSMVGVMPMDYYKDFGDLAGYDFINLHRNEIPSLVSDRIDRINARLNLGIQNEFHRERVVYLNSIARMRKKYIAYLSG